MILLESVIALGIFDAVLCAASSRVRNLHRAFFNLFLGKTENANLGALIDLAKEDLNKTSTEFNKALAEHAGSTDEIMTTVQQQRDRHEQLLKTVQFYVDKKDDVNAGKFAAELEKLEGELSVNEARLQKAESIYQNLTATRDAKIAQGKKTLEELASKVKDTALENKTNDLIEQAAALEGSFSQSGQNLARLSEMVNKASSQAHGRSRVTADLDAKKTADGPLQIPTEVSEQGALARFKARSEPKQLNAPVETVPLTLHTGEKVQSNN